MLSNLELAQTFIQSSLHNQDVLLANPGLQAQTTFGKNQMMAKREGIIVTFKLNTTPRQFLVKARTSYWELINQVLAECHFLIAGEVDRNECYPFQICQVPKGYQMHCTKSVILWRAWWKYSKSNSSLGIPLNLFIRTRETWYPVRDLAISDGVLYVKTLGSEIALHADDLVVWLSKQPASDPTVEQSTQRPAS